MQNKHTKLPGPNPTMWEQLAPLGPSQTQLKAKLLSTKLSVGFAMSLQCHGGEDLALQT